MSVSISSSEAREICDWGVSELSRPLQIMDGGTIEGVERWLIQVDVVDDAGQTTLSWETGAEEEVVAGTYRRTLPHRE